MDDEEVGAQSEESRDKNEVDGSKEDDGADESYSKKWGWLSWVFTVTKETNLTVNDVYRLNIVEFLTYICFLKDKAAKEERDVKRWKVSH